MDPRNTSRTTWYRWTRPLWSRLPGDVSMPTSDRAGKPENVPGQDAGVIETVVFDVGETLVDETREYGT